MVVVRSMRGIMVDMGKLFKDNQDTIALTGSSVKMNARGDIILPNGQIKRVEEIEEEQKQLKKEKERISLSNNEKLKKFYLKKKFMTPKEIQESLKKINESSYENDTGDNVKNVDELKNFDFYDLKYQDKVVDEKSVSKKNASQSKQK